MSEHPHAVANELHSVLPDGFAVSHVLVGEFLRRSECERLLLLDGFARAHLGEHAKHGVHGIDSGGAGVFEGLENLRDVAGKLLHVAPAKGSRALGQSVRRRRPDGSGPTHHHVRDRAGGGAVVACLHQFK